MPARNIEAADMLEKDAPKVEHTDCFVCGGKNTLEVTRSKGNCLRHGSCTKCGMRFSWNRRIDHDHCYHD